MYRGLRLSHRLMLGMAFFAVLGLALAYLVVVTVVRGIVYDNVLENTYRTHHIHAQQMDAWFEHAAQITYNLAETLPMVNEESYQAIIIHTRLRHDYIENVWIVFEDGRFYDSLFWTMPEGMDFTEREWWYYAAAASGQVINTRPYVSIMSGVPVTTLARHNANWHGQAGVIAMSITLEQLGDMMQNFHPDYESQLMLVGPFGGIIIHSNPDYLPCEEYVHNVQDHPVYEALFARFAAGETIIRENYYFMHFHLPSTGWTLVAIVPTSVTDTPVWQTLGAVLLTVIGVLGLVMIFATVFITTRFVRPLARLTHTVGEIPHRELTESIRQLTIISEVQKLTIIRRTRTDEISHLQQAIHTMLADLHEHKEREERERAEESAGFMLESAPMGVLLHDKDFNLITCNSRAMEMLGYDDKDALIKNIAQTVAPVQPDMRPSADVLKEYFAKALDEGYAFIGEFVRKRKGGKYFSTEATYARIRYHGDFAILEFTQDITERILAEEREAEKREADRLSRTFMDNSPMLIELRNAAFDLVYCNHRVLELMEAPTMEEYERNFQQYSPEVQLCGTPSMAKFDILVRKIFTEGYANFEWVHQSASGEQLPMDVTFVQVTNNDGPMYIGYSHDLRGIKTVMDNEQKLAIALQEQEFMRKLEQKNIEAAEESNRAKSRFLARMSHEIRTPLTAVLGITEIEMRHGDLPPRFDAALTKIYDASHSLLHIVNDILDFSKIESGKMELIHAEYSLAALINETTLIRLSYTEKKDLLFFLYVDEKLPTHFIGDALRIRQILSNLLSNALKYTPAGKVTMTITYQEAPVPCINFAIADTGIGLTAAQLASIQDEYVRVHEEELNFVSGTGLGIPIVHSLAQLMDATFTMESMPNQGTIARISIPQQPGTDHRMGATLAAALQNFESATDVADKVTQAQAQYPQARVLVVDDVETNLFVAQAILESFGITVETCESGLIALERIKAGHHYDLFFIDHMMPTLDGIQTTQQLRALGCHKPIIALTANAVKGQDALFIASGFDGFMSKPIEIEVMAGYLARFLKK